MKLQHPFRIVITDDYEPMRYAIGALIGRESELAVAGQAGNAEELLQLLETVPADLVVLDLGLPGMDGIQAIERIHERFPNLRILVHSMMDDWDTFLNALARGVSGYVLKNDDPQTLLRAIHDIRAGKTFFSRQVREYMRENRPAVEDAVRYSFLTEEEREIVRLATGGSSRREIAGRLRLSLAALRGAYATILTKLDVDSLDGYAPGLAAS